MKNILYFFAALFLLTSCTTPKLDIDKIEFKAEPCFGTCPVFDMKIANSGVASFNAVMFNKIQGRFKTVIDISKIDSINLLLGKASFLRLDNKYSVNITDQPTYTLIVKLKNGQTKTIVDYGPSGPDKLKKVYKFLFSIADSQNWK